MNKKLSIGLVLALLLSILLVISFSHKSTQNETGKIQMAASFYPLYFFASEIGGDKTSVVNITPPGAEPHDYEPTTGDMVQIESSRLLILNGGGLEAWSSNVQQNINSYNTKIVIAGADLTNQEVVEDGEKITDPHIWLSPILAEKMVEKIAQGFELVDPVNMNYYSTNADALKVKLSQLDNEYKNTLINCSQKNIITSHTAFGYLASAYGLNQVPISGLSPDAEPSPKQLADITKFAKDNHVKYIFFESLVSPKLSETIANEVGVKTMVLNPIEGLTKDEVNAGMDYFTKMRDNLSNLTTVLECKN